MIGVQAATCAPFPGSLRARPAGGGGLGADDRRRDRGQASGRAHARADRPLGERDRRRRGGRRRRGDGVPPGARQARGRGRRRGRRGGADVGAARSGERRRNHGDRALGRERRRRRCWPRWRVVTRLWPGAGWCCWRACPTDLARWRVLLALVGELRANLVDVQHIREGVDLHVRETAVQLVLETRGPEHAAEVTRAIRQAGYAETRVLR